MDNYLIHDICKIIYRYNHDLTPCLEEISIYSIYMNKMAKLDTHIKITQAKRILNKLKSPDYIGNYHHAVDRCKCGSFYVKKCEWCRSEICLNCTGYSVFMRFDLCIRCIELKYIS